MRGDLLQEGPQGIDVLLWQLKVERKIHGGDVHGDVVGIAL